MANHRDIQRLFEKYMINSCSPEEAAELMRVLQSGEHRHYMEQLIERHLQGEPDTVTDDLAPSRVFEKLSLENRKKDRLRYRLPTWTKAVAAVLLVASVAGFYSYLRNGKNHPIVAEQDVSPGGYRATLTLEDGSTIDLSTSQAGIVVGESIKYLDGTSVRDTRTQAAADRQLNLSLSTPMGGTYQVTLPDGTKAWLNSASTLTYPNHFPEHERVVRLEGEAYFEVQPSADAPFRVQSAGQAVEVLGTAFNVNAYPDEQTTNTTLVEGAVRVVAAQNTTVLKPGQQAKVGANRLTVSEVDIETTIDWKSGDFFFTDESLESIMRKVARWYNVDVVYQDKLPSEKYSAQISRNRNLSEVLHILELSGGLTYAIKNNTVFLSAPESLINKSTDNQFAH